MQPDHLLRRDFLTYGSAAFAGLAVLRSSMAQAFPARPGEEVVPWADQPPPVPDAASGVVQNLPKWEDLNTWVTPNERFFSVSHYDRPVIDEKTWALEIGGSVARSAPADTRRHQGPPPARGRLHARMLWQSWFSLAHLCRRECPVGRHAACADPGGGAGARQRSEHRLLWRG